MKALGQTYILEMIKAQKPLFGISISVMTHKFLIIQGQPVYAFNNNLLLRLILWKSCRDY